MTLKKSDLFALLAIPSESGDQALISAHVEAVCKKLGCHVTTDHAGNTYATKGTGKTCPAFVAHLDTVHRIEIGGIRPVEIDGYITGINPVTMGQTGIGGDDKCGIWAALRCLESLPHAKAAFFTDEEIGCVGSWRADLSFFSDCRFILQADRRGSADFVESIGGDIQSKAFKKAVKPLLKEYRFRPCGGAMTDVMALSEAGVGISCANISAGYYNPHSPQEYISLPELDHTISLMLAISRTCTDVFPHSPPPRRKHKSPPLPASTSLESVWSEWEMEDARHFGESFEWPSPESRETLPWYDAPPTPKYSRKW